MTAEPTAYRKATLAAALSATVLCAAALGLAAPCAAAPNLRESLFGSHGADSRRAPAPPIARYVSEDGDIFVLDRTNGRPLLKFDDSFEVWVLRPQPAPRGDVIYKNDQGDPMLRATRLGGVTLFTDERPAGVAAALAGAGAPLRLQPMGPQALLERLAQASARASRAARRLIPFDAEATPESSALVADAALVTSEAVVRMTRTADTRRKLLRLQKVRLVVGRRANAQLERGELRVTVAPSHGLAGRPSSERIAVAAGGR